MKPEKMNYWLDNYNNCHCQCVWQECKLIKCNKSLTSHWTSVTEQIIWQHHRRKCRLHRGILILVKIIQTYKQVKTVSNLFEDHINFSISIYIIVYTKIMDLYICPWFHCQYYITCVDIMTDSWQVWHY